MTPNVSEKEAKQVRDKFDATYMKGRGKVNTEGLIMDITDKPEMLGSSGIFGILGGGVAQLAKGASSVIGRSAIFNKIVKSFTNAPKQYSKLAGNNKIVKSFMNTPKQYSKLAGKPFETSYRNINSGINQLKSKHLKQQTIRPLITGNKVYDKKMINDAFAKRFGSAKQKAVPANRKSVIRDHVAKKPEKDALTHPYFNRLRK